MAKLNHTIVAAHDPDASALFLSEVMGLPAPVHLGHFTAVTVGDQLTLDFAKARDRIHTQHYAFLVTEGEFDAIFERVKERQLTYWADPFRSKPREFNHWDDGRGVYFEDPSGHLLEILTRPYGSAGTTAENPHPLIAEKVKNEGVRAQAQPVKTETREHAKVETHPLTAEMPNGFEPLIAH